MTFPKTGGPEWAASQASPHVSANEAGRRFDANVSRAIIIDRDLTAPPGACTDGANYQVAAAPTGAWSGQAGKLATAVGTNAANGWLFQTVTVEGYRLYVQDENAELMFDGAAWIAAISGSVASTTEQLVGTDAAKVSSPNSVAALWEQGSDVASAGTVTLGEGGYFNITGTTAITDIDFATDKAGRKVWLKFAGVLTLTNGASLILPTAANIATEAGDTACFVSEGSDVVRCIAYTRASGQALAGGGGGGGGSWHLQFHPYDNEAPISNFATFDTRNSHPCLDFDQTTQETAIFSAVLPYDYTGGGITVDLHWAATTPVTTGTIGWLVSIERVGTALDIDAASFATAQTVTAVTVNSTNGILSKTSVSITDGANMDSLAAGESFRLRVERDVANDTATGDAELYKIMIVET